MVEIHERVGAVGLCDRPGQAYEAIQDLIDAGSAPLAMRLHRIGPRMWRPSVLVGRTDFERDEDLEEDEEIRFPPPEQEPPADFPEDPERPPRQPN